MKRPVILQTSPGRASLGESHVNSFFPVTFHRWAGFCESGPFSEQKQQEAKVKVIKQFQRGVRIGSQNSSVWRRPTLAAGSIGHCGCMACVIEMRCVWIPGHDGGESKAAHALCPERSDDGISGVLA